MWIMQGGQDQGRGKSSRLTYTALTLCVCVFHVDDIDWVSVVCRDLHVVCMYIHVHCSCAWGNNSIGRLMVRMWLCGTWLHVLSLLLPSLLRKLWQCHGLDHVVKLTHSKEHTSKIVFAAHKVERERERERERTLLYLNTSTDCNYPPLSLVLVAVLASLRGEGATSVSEAGRLGHPPVPTTPDGEQPPL